MLFVLIYIFALIGYFGVGILVYVNFDDYQFNKTEFFFKNFLIKLFYKNNEKDCDLEDGRLWYKTREWRNGTPNYQSKIYYESDKWNTNYQPFLSIFELINLIFWPVWILINLIIGAFYDD